MDEQIDAVFEHATSSGVFSDKEYHGGKNLPTTTNSKRVIAEEN
jgi:hypothetical protein